METQCVDKISRTKLCFRAFCFPWAFTILSLLILFPLFLSLFKTYFIDYALIVVSLFFLPLFPSALYHTSHQHSPTPLVHVHGRTYKFFGFSISYMILHLPLSILYLPVVLLIPRTLSPILPT